MARLPWWSEGVRFQCQGTGRCCVSRGSYGYVYLTIEDRRRLAKHFGLTTSAFTRRHCQRTDGHWHLRDRTDRCRYLEGTRCGVYDARPTQCRTWPFWPENMKARVWTTEIVTFCPGVGKGRLHAADEIRSLLRLGSAASATAPGRHDTSRARPRRGS